MIAGERLAQNVNDTGGTASPTAPAGFLVVEPAGPAGGAYATMRFAAMVLAMRKAGVPADVSDAAGTFVI